MAEGSDDPEGEDSSEWFLPPSRSYPAHHFLNTAELRIGRSFVCPPTIHTRDQVRVFFPNTFAKEGKKMSDMAAIIERGKKVLIGNYARQPLVMSRGEGSLVWDSSGKKYIDLFAGFGGAVLGHSHPALIEA